MVASELRRKNASSEILCSYTGDIIATLLAWIIMATESVARTTSATIYGRRGLSV